MSRIMTVKFKEIGLILLFQLISTHHVVQVHGSNPNAHPAAKNSGATILYYGWFFDPQIATSLETIYFKHLADVFTIEPVSTFLKNVSVTNNVDNPLLYYTKPLDPATGELDPNYHVTAMYCGDTDCSEYATKVNSNLSRTFGMTLIGYYFTERTFGVRILLTKEQQELFDEPVGKVLEGSKVIKVEEEYAGIWFMPQDRDFHPSQSKAHITLGCAPNVPAYITGLDLLEIVQYENFSKEKVLAEFNTTAGILRQYSTFDSVTHKMAFVFYPHDKIVTFATFQPYYMPDETSSILRLSPIHLVVYLLLVSCIY